MRVRSWSEALLSIRRATFIWALLGLLWSGSAHPGLCENELLSVLPDIELTAETRLELKTLQGVWEKTQKRNNALYLDYSKRVLPNTLSVRGSSFDVVDLIGYGDEGEVYLVSRNGRKYAAKVLGSYASPDTISELVTLRKEGYSAVEVLDYDQATKTALLQYIDGVDVAVIEHSDLIYHVALSPPLMTEILAAYQRFEGRNRIALKKRNVLLDFSTGRFVTIDFR